MKMKKIAYGLLAFAPIFAFAQGTGLSVFQSIVTQAGAILRLLIPMAFGLAILYFFYGIAKYVLSAGDAEKAKEGKSIMIYGVIAIAVMASLFGLVVWLQNVFGVQTGTAIQPPVITGF
jgi:hypothetical protein